MPRPRLLGDRLPLPSSFRVGDHKAYGELHTFSLPFAYTQTKRFHFSEVQPPSWFPVAFVCLCAEDRKTEATLLAE
jgi:hypothetical protein